MTIQCNRFGVEAMATQSILMRLFFFFACFGDSLSQTAQSYVPAVLYSRRNANNTENSPSSSSKLSQYKDSRNISTPKAVGGSDLTRMLRRLLILGVWIGVLNSQLSTFLVRQCGQYITKDIAITTLMTQHSKFMGLSLLVHPFIMLLEGIVLANRDYRTLIFTYATTMVMHFTILSKFCHSFPAVWRTFFLFQCTRLSLYAYRVVRWWWSSERTTMSDDSSHNVVNTVET
jgi:Na+-driven multidrug efflux pump